MTTELEQALKDLAEHDTRPLGLTPAQEAEWAKLREAAPKTGPVTYIKARPKSEARTRYQEKFEW